ncbi:MAG TPA: carbon-nitrogen family hydrolase [Verrucomicrobiae bacterium]|nr:carbon-nitrogen family hydrolase [Verrucomicrobiae bacterium]
MKVYCCQTDIVWENKQRNFASARQLIDSAKPEPRSLVLLPEMFATGFSMNVPGIAEGVKSETADFLAAAAREFSIYLMGGIVTTAPDHRGYNQAAVFNPQGKEIARYSKMQPFSLGGEAKAYAAGDDVVIFDWEGVKVAPFVCYDLRFPEGFRRAVRKGAEMFAVIANWPVMRIGHWVTLLQARAIENLAFVAGTNRCGTDPKLQYNGRSIIVSEHGNVLADAGDGHKVIFADVNPAAIRQWRTDFPALSDMRPE